MPCFCVFKTIESVGSYRSWFQSNFYVHRWREGRKPKSHYVMLHPYKLDALHNTNCHVIKRWTDKVKLCSKINTDTDTKKISKKINQRFLNQKKIFYESVGFGQTNMFFFMALVILFLSNHNFYSQVYIIHIYFVQKETYQRVIYYLTLT